MRNCGVNSRTIRFAAFELDTANAELRKHGVRLRLQEQPFRILAALLERPGDVVTREELVARLWPDGTFVDFERSLNAAINRLRQVLGDSADAPRYVETVARRGYRFIGSVIAGAPVSLVERLPSTIPVTRRWSWAILLPIATALAISCAVYVRSSVTASVGPVVTRITSDSGLTTEPAVSPDGKLLAYVSDRNGHNLNLWVQQLTGGTAVQLTRGGADVHSPAFSPDGSRIVYRSEQNGGGLYVIPALGGDSRYLVGEGRDPKYSPDGKWIAYWSGTLMSSVPNADPLGHVFIVSSEGGTPRQLARDLPSAGYPVWSSDSQHLIVTVDPHHSTERAGMDWYLVPVNGGTPLRTHAFDRLRSFGIAVQYGSAMPKISSWIDGAVLFAAASGDAVNIWKARLTAPAGVLEHLSRLTAGTNLEIEPSAGLDGRLTFASVVRNVSLYMLAGDTNRAQFSRLDRITEQTGSDFTPSLSADGRLLAFTCGKEAAICVKDLSTGEQRTVTGGPHWNPQISPDGSRIAYTLNSSGPMPLFVIPAFGGAPQKLMDEGGWAFGWFRDNRRLLYRKSYSLQVHAADVLSRSHELFVARDGYAVYQTKLSPDENWVTVEAVSLERMTSQIYIAPVSRNIAGPAKDWVPIGFAGGWDDKPRWSPDGELVYFLSHHDGFRCLWAQRLDKETRRPRAEPFTVFHFHNARLSPMNVGLGVIELGIASDKIVLNLGELSGNIWALKQL